MNNPETLASSRILDHALQHEGRSFAVATKSDINDLLLHIKQVASEVRWHVGADQVIKDIGEITTDILKGCTTDGVLVVTVVSNRYLTIRLNWQGMAYVPTALGRKNPKVTASYGTQFSQIEISILDTNSTDWESKSRAIRKSLFENWTSGIRRRTSTKKHQPYAAPQSH